MRVLWGDDHAFGHHRLALFVASTSNIFQIEKAANNIGIQYFVSILVLETNHTAFAAAITQRFPLGRAEIGQLPVFPKWFGHNLINPDFDQRQPVHQGMHQHRGQE